MKKRDLKKYSYLIRNIAYAMAICFVWLLIETAYQKGNTAKACEIRDSSSSNNVLISFENNQKDWEQEYWNLCIKMNQLLDELDILEQENIKKAIVETENKFISNYESQMPKTSITIDKNLLDIDLKNYYSFAIKCTNMITGRATVFTTTTNTFDNKDISFEMPYGSYIVNEINLYTLNNDSLTEYKVQIEPFQVKQLIGDI